MTELHPVRIVGIILLQCILVYIQAIIMPSFIITSIHIAVVVIGFVSGILAYLKKSHFLRLITVWSSLAAWLFFVSLRAWMILFDNSLLVAFLLVVILVLAGALHYLNQGLSEFLYREQMNPQTKGGKLFRRYIVWVIVIWTFIARGGIVIHRPGDMELLPRFLWYMAIMAYSLSAGFTFFAVYQCIFLEPTGSIWKKWSWKWKRKKKKKAENERAELP
jgi:hypothetical protein